LGWREDVGRLTPEWNMPAAVKVCSQAAAPLPAAFCRLIFSACFLPAGFVSNRFRHIVNDTNYKERGIFYG